MARYSRLFCDFCGTEHEAEELYQVSIPVYRDTETNEGSTVAPYITVGRYDFCLGCLKSVTVLHERDRIMTDVSDLRPVSQSTVAKATKVEGYNHPETSLADRFGKTQWEKSHCD